MHQDLRKGIGIAVQLAFVMGAAVMVYGFVKTTGVGRPQPGSAEERRLCLPACILRPDYMDATRIAPDFTLPRIDFDETFHESTGPLMSLSDLRGKVVVLNFWSKDCGPCIQEMSALDDLSSILTEKFKGEVVLLSVTFDENEKEIADTLRAILPKPPRFTVLHDAENAIVRPVYGTSLVPETWIIDKRGVVRARFDGARTSEEGKLIWAESTVVQLIDQNPLERALPRPRRALGHAAVSRANDAPASHRADQGAHGPRDVEDRRDGAPARGDLGRGRRLGEAYRARAKHSPDDGQRWLAPRDLGESARADVGRQPRLREGQGGGGLASGERPLRANDAAIALFNAAVRPSARLWYRSPPRARARAVRRAP